MEEIGIPELTSEQVEELCEVAEKAAREYILSKLPQNRISVLNITVETEGTRPVTVDVDVEITVSPILKNRDVKKLANEATRNAFTSVEIYLRELACKSAK
ncbi:MAG: DUF3194 domain-containing protein [Candidatus Bathyarchaeota archaeon]|nr:MAG: DUF3194 domain-containing protein [Candidatus Bathyarchaeota archaeon]